LSTARCRRLDPASSWKTPLVSLPRGWRQRYFERDYFADPAALHLQRSTILTWSDTLAWHYTTMQRRIIQEASEFGMPGGSVVPLVGLGTRTAIIELAGSNTDSAQEKRRSFSSPR
jgi:hypothetical protein